MGSAQRSALRIFQQVFCVECYFWIRISFFLRKIIGKSCTGLPIARWTLFKNIKHNNEFARNTCKLTEFLTKTKFIAKTRHDPNVFFVLQLIYFFLNVIIITSWNKTNMSHIAVSDNTVNCICNYINTSTISIWWNKKCKYSRIIYLSNGLHFIHHDNGQGTRTIDSWKRTIKFIQIEKKLLSSDYDRPIFMTNM